MEEEFSVKREDYATWLTRSTYANPMFWTFFYHVDDLTPKTVLRLKVSQVTIEEWFVDHSMIVEQGP